ncbi:hypothetical protein QQX98_006708 [Neonectria punicea]|uniref:SH3 domain-containing protein n=1 Tax=Neonectria punicea TaxID=979145 RepID=A0ABR1GZZ8_9HYPO
MRTEPLQVCGPKLKFAVTPVVIALDAEAAVALNDILKKELPILSSLTKRVGNICLGNLVNIQADWYRTWKKKMKTVLGDCSEVPDLDEVVSIFQRDFPYAHDQLKNIGILNVTLGLPDFGRHRSGSLAMPSDTGGTGFGSDGVIPSPHGNNYPDRDYYSDIQVQTETFASPRSPEISGSSRSAGVLMQSLESANAPRQDSTRTYNSSHQPHEDQGFSHLFHSSLPLPDETEASPRSSSASLREQTRASDGYNILWLAAALFEMNISTVRNEAGYPYLTYQAGEIFDVVAEKGDLWLAKNQDDPTDEVGWIWSKHFAKLADS